jgi:CRISPR-associated endoribonuclease Cas6
VTLTTFPTARYRFDWQATWTIRLPDYAGSMLRGAFGHALRQLSCMTRQKECAGCPLLTSCPYPAIFEPPPPAEHALQKFSAIPVPYIIEPPESGSRVLEPGESFSFSMVLIGRALRELPLIILAWRRAFARGIGAGDGIAELVSVSHCGTIAETEIHRPTIGTVIPHEQNIVLPSAAGGDVVAHHANLRILTPLRLQKNGHALPPEKLDARVFLMALVRRANLLAEFHGNGRLVEDFAVLGAASLKIHDKKQLVWRDWTRYSSRQHQKMALGGVVGEWTFEGELGMFSSFLELGQWLHVGKEAAFGLGRYRVMAAGEQKSC